MLACRHACAELQLARQQQPWMAGPTGMRESALGLSTMAACILGRPVNKAMQTSAWRRRPLSSAQLQYAALDAHASVQIWDKLAANISPEQLERLRALAS